MEAFNNIISKIEQYFVGIILLFITALVFINVVLRAIGISIDGAEEIARYGIVWVTFVGSSICVYKGAHIGVDAIMGLLPEKGKKMTTIITLAISIIFILLFTIKSYSITMRIAEMNQRSSTLKISMIYVYGAMPVGGTLMLIRYIQEFIKSIKNFNEKGGGSDDSSII